MINTEASASSNAFARDAPTRSTPSRRGTVQLNQAETAGADVDGRGTYDERGYNAHPPLGVKVTIWRVTNSVLILGLGLPKAITTYQGGTVVPTTLDWLLGVVLALSQVWGSAVEAEGPLRSSVVFDFDIAPSIVSLSSRVAKVVTRITSFSSKALVMAIGFGIPISWLIYKIRNMDDVTEPTATLLAFMAFSIWLLLARAVRRVRSR